MYYRRRLEKYQLICVDVDVRVLTFCKGIDKYPINVYSILLVQCVIIPVTRGTMGQSENLLFHVQRSLAAHHIPFSG